MRAFAFVSATSIALAAAPAAAVAAVPQRVASLNLCTDELLLLLAAPDQIVSVTHLSQSAAETPLWQKARRYRKNDGSLVSVAPLRPDLVLTMGGGGRDRVRIAGRLGIRTLDLPYPQTVGDIAAGVRSVARALGRERAAAPVLARMAALRRSTPPQGADTLWLGGGGRTLGARSLGAEWMALAGLKQRPVTGDRVSLETLLVAPPAVLLKSDYRAGQYSNEQRWLSHPLAKNVRAGRTLRTDGRLWTCMGPMMAGEMGRLRKALGR